MTRESKNLSYGKYIYATCARRRCSNEVCSNSYFYNMTYVNEIVLNEINKLLDDYYDEMLITVKEDTVSNDIEKDNISERICSLEKSLKDKNGLKYNLYIDKSNGTLSESDFILFNNKLQEEIASISDQIKSLKNFFKENLEKNSSDERKEKVLSKYRHIDSLDSCIVNEFIEKIYLSRDSNGKKVVEIHWKF